MKTLEKENQTEELFKRKNKNLLSVYYTAGYPALNDTVRIGQWLAQAGADMIEIGIPFSDPVADGPVIQESSKVALENGMTLNLLLEQVGELRSDVNVPIVLMGYINPILQMGVASFCERAAHAGVDAVIIPDLPLLEYQESYQGIFESWGIKNIFMVTPTTSEERIRAIDDSSSAFIYVVSSSGTTGARKDFSEEQIDYLNRLKQMKLKNPWLVGFGVSNNTTFSTICDYGAGAIVGSAFIAMLKNSNNFSADIPNFVQSIKAKS